MTETYPSMYHFGGNICNCNFWQPAKDSQATATRNAMRKWVNDSFLKDKCSDVERSGTSGELADLLTAFMVGRNFGVQRGCKHLISVYYWFPRTSRLLGGSIAQIWHTHDRWPDMILRIPAGLILQVPKRLRTHGIQQGVRKESSSTQPNPHVWQNH